MSEGQKREEEGEGDEGKGEGARSSLSEGGGIPREAGRKRWVGVLDRHASADAEAS
jgi:hypothetical protein